MSDSARSISNEIKKMHVEATITFAINHVPKADPATLEKFLELVNVTGTFGAISEEELLEKMALLLRHVPGTCEYSLKTIGEILGICFPEAELDDKVVGVIMPSNSDSGRRAV
ncbi:MAG: hypothetical protein R3264_12545, partial [Anaerolineae bacterium]|nr:hypothetical protein [Anaerolineae bacterium]